MGIEKDLNKTQKKLFLEAVTKRYKKWKNDRTDKEETWQECFDAFICAFSDDTEIAEFRSQRFIPLSFEAVMNVQSQMAKGLFPSTAFFTAQGDNPQSQKYEKLRTIYMQNRMEASGFVEEFVSGHIWQLLVYGNAPYRLSWDNRRSRSRQTYETEEGEQRLGYQVGNQEFSISPYIYDGPKFESLDLFNFYRSPHADDSSHGEIKIYRELISKADLLDQCEEVYELSDGTEWTLFDKKEVKKALQEASEPPKEKSDSDKQTRHQAFGIQGTDKFDEDTLEIITAVGDFPIDNELFKDYTVSIINRKYLVRCELSPYTSGLSSLRMGQLIPIKGMPYALGILENALSLQEVTNITTNNTIDSANMIKNPPLLVRDDGVIDADDLVYKPGVVWSVEDVDTTIKPLFLPQHAMSGYTESNILKEMFKDATMSHASFGSQAQPRTATEVATDAGMMQTNVGRLIQRTENKDIEDILLFFDEAEKQFYDPESEVFQRYEDNEFEQITPEVIYGSYTWKAVGSGFTHLRDLRVQQLNQLLISAAQTPAAKGVDFVAAFQAQLNDMGRRDTEKIMPGVEAMMRKAVETGEIPPQLLEEALQIAQQLAKQRSQGSAGGPGGPGRMGPQPQTPPGMAPSRGNAIPNLGGVPDSGSLGRIRELE